MHINAQNLSIINVHTHKHKYSQTHTVGVCLIQVWPDPTYLISWYGMEEGKRQGHVLENKSLVQKCSARSPPLTRRRAPTPNLDSCRRIPFPSHNQERSSTETLVRPQLTLTHMNRLSPRGDPSIPNFPSELFNAFMSITIYHQPALSNYM